MAVVKMVLAPVMMGTPPCTPGVVAVIMMIAIEVVDPIATRDVMFVPVALAAITMSAVTAASVTEDRCYSPWLGFEIQAGAGALLVVGPRASPATQTMTLVIAAASNRFHRGQEVGVRVTFTTVATRTTRGGNIQRDVVGNQADAIFDGRDNGWTGYKGRTRAVRHHQRAD